MTKEELEKLFEYKDGELYWKVTRNNKTKKGMLAGGRSINGYIYVTINNKNYRAHRIIYLLHHGVAPKILDHIDGNRQNNKIANLREATSSQNSMNSKIKKDNTSGVKGVHLHKPTGKWIVRVNINKQRKHLGLFEDFELAALVATEARDKYYGEFANHGN